MARPYTGTLQVLPTTFDEAGNLDSESQLRAVDFFLGAGVDGFTILANYSEQFALSDAERETLTRSILKHTAGRVPVIVTTTHYRIGSPPSGAGRPRTSAPHGDADAALPRDDARRGGWQLPSFSRPFRTRSNPDHDPGRPGQRRDPLGGVPCPTGKRDPRTSSTSGSRVPGTTVKIRELLRLVGPSHRGRFDGEEAITLIDDLGAGATGDSGGMVPGAPGARWCNSASRPGRRSDRALTSGSCRC